MVARRRYLISGLVQGVGFRPAVSRLARKMGVTGTVCNTGSGVEIDAEADGGILMVFEDHLKARPPFSHWIESVEAVESEPLFRQGFAIIESDTESNSESNAKNWRPPTIPPDQAICIDCEKELKDPKHRLFQYAFIACAHCGPRYSVLNAFPYDRPRTEMRHFPLCTACHAEYENPESRRHHAQTLSCADCGPRVSLIFPHQGPGPLDKEAVDLARAALMDGKIVAVKGMGGFQLMVLANDAEAVLRLRRKKRRPRKPLALMVPSDGDEHLGGLAAMDERARKLLNGPVRPVVLLRKSATFSKHIADCVTFSSPEVGVMLPTTGLHHLLLDGLVEPVVCTSGNIAGAPLCISDEEALERLGDVADVILTHNRPILRPVDDSVVRPHRHGQTWIRVARGVAPLRMPLFQPGEDFVGLGSHLKNAFAIALGRVAVVSSHVGDLENPETRSRLEKDLADMEGLFQREELPRVTDAHPDLGGTILAEKSKRAGGPPLFHHHAHAAAVLGEKGIAEEVLALTWDGLGLGPDHTLWGGEIALATPQTFTRVASILPIPLWGGQAAILEPRRVAACLLALAFEDVQEATRRLGLEKQEEHFLEKLMRSPERAPLSSGMGRLFDGVAHLLGFSGTRTFDGEPAMWLEALAHGATHMDNRPDGPLPFGEIPPTQKEAPHLFDWRPSIRHLVTELEGGALAADLALAFHQMLVEYARAVVARWPEKKVVLSGGVFANALLTERLMDALIQDGREVHLPQRLPPHDGALAYGQAVIHRARSF
jgi:hydrogenase maturation protein HypF